jgi:pimeloyl-ACP methyl ester carboxylesterase
MFILPGKIPVHFLTPCIALIFLMPAACRKEQPVEVAAEQFVQWFVGTSLRPPKHFTTLTDSAINSLCAGFRNQCQPESGSVVIADAAGQPYTMGYRAPHVFRKDSTYPCLIYLHGGTGSDRTDKGENAYAMLDMLADSMSLFLVSPSASRDAPWWGATGLSRILQSLRYMTLHFPINPDKVLLVGVSDGATGCYAAANTIAAPFAGFIAISGYGGMLPQLGMELYPHNCMQRPIYNINAGNDRLYPIETVTAFLDGLESAGVYIRRKVYEDEEHGFGYRYREAGTICSLIREWSRPDPEAVNWEFGTAYPVSINHVLATEPENGTIKFLIEAGCTNDTFFIKTSGIKKVRMYFEEAGRCAGRGIFKINHNKCRKFKPDAIDQETNLMLMKQRCFPEIKKMFFFTFVM